MSPIYSLVPWRVRLLKYRCLLGSGPSLAGHHQFRQSRLLENVPQRNRRTFPKQA